VHKTKEPSLFSPIRFIQIGIAIYGYLFWWALVRAGLWRTHLTPAQKFSRMLEKLGTPFVKLGQGLSMHTEFLPDDYVAALTSLEDHVAPFPGEQAVHEIERSFGHSLGDLFAHFDATPLAAASIAQVHAARLHHGPSVIVKVRRPGIKRRGERA
jgi:ubiquinone biosynthesis protein